MSSVTLVSSSSSSSCLRLPFEIVPRDITLTSGPFLAHLQLHATGAPCRPWLQMTQKVDKFLCFLSDWRERQKLADCEVAVDLRRPLSCRRRVSILRYCLQCTESYPYCKKRNKEKRKEKEYYVNQDGRRNEQEQKSQKR